jgi:hypothetical protein
MSAIMAILTPIITAMEAKWGVVGTILGYTVVVGLPVMSSLMALMETVMGVVNSTASAATAAKIEAIYNAVLPYLEVLPHANIPLSPVVSSIISVSGKVVSAIQGAISGWLGSNNPPPPPAPPAS